MWREAAVDSPLKCLSCYFDSTSIRFSPCIYYIKYINPVEALVFAQGPSKIRDLGLRARAPVCTILLIFLTIKPFVPGRE